MHKNHSIIWMSTSYCQASQSLTSLTSTRRTTMPPEHLKWDTHSSCTNTHIIPSCILLFACFPRWPVRVFVSLFKSQQFNGINQNVKVTAVGTGEATLRVSKKQYFCLDHLLCIDVSLWNSRLFNFIYHNECNIKMHFCLCDRWCHCITLCLKKMRVTVNSLTCLCSSSKVILSLPLYILVFICCFLCSLSFFL